MHLLISQYSAHAVRRILILLSVAWAFGALFSSPAHAQEGALKATSLRCEHLVNPMGVEVKSPRLGWIVESSKRAQVQLAYQILVASSDELLKNDKGDLWDSGKQASNETIDIAYSGKPLQADQRCFWKVRVWDGSGAVSAWSEPAMWSVGLSDADWRHSQWIGYDKGHDTKLHDAPLDGAKWIGAGDKPDSAPPATREFISTLKLPANAKIQSAQVCLTAKDLFWMSIDGKEIAHTQQVPDVRRPAVVDITQDLKPGDNPISIRVQNSSPGATLVAKFTVDLENGKQIVLATDDSWSVQENGANHPVKVEATYGDAPYGNLKTQTPVLPPAEFLRTSFNIDKPVQAATLYVSALGICNPHLNGKRFSNDHFIPGWTDYTKRVYYRAYDVTSLLTKGENVIGTTLGDGWYSGYLGYARVRDQYGSKPRFRAELHIQFADGSEKVIGTGPDWRGSTGAITEADFLMGETFDARLHEVGWDDSGFNANGWSPVDVGAEVHPVLQWHPGPAVVPIKEFQPTEIKQPKPGIYVLNMGQNFAGVARIKVHGDAGQSIVLRFAERLNPDGTIYTENLRSARATDTYICAGDGEETWEPHLTFHGFQYIEVTGLKSPPGPDTIVGIALSSDTPIAGSFECSDPMVNQLHSNIYWTQRSNFIDIPTDCPQRDERLGWMGDAQVYIRAAALNTDVQAFFTKWLVDVTDAQRADGQFPMVAPVKVAGDDGGPAWADAGVICPWTIYQVYHDKRLLERQYPSMKRFIEFCGNRSTADLLPPKQYHCFGDWLSVGADTPKDVIYEAYFARSTHLTAQAARVLGREADAKELDALFARIKTAFNRAYVKSDGRIEGNTQACYVLALSADLLDEPMKKLAAQHLVEDIQQRGWHLSTGFIGTKDLMLVLAAIGRDDVAYRLLQQKTFPGWGFSIEHGATSIWERWDGWTPEKGFQDPGMNSFAHYSFGAVYQWMVENIGGIRSTDDSAYAHILIAPRPGGTITWARTSYNSVHGAIATDWSLKGNQFTLNVTIPANTTAVVEIPFAIQGELQESGRAAQSAPGVRSVQKEGSVTHVEIGSGQYQFRATINRARS